MEADTIMNMVEFFPNTDILSFMPLQEIMAAQCNLWSIIQPEVTK